MAYLKGKSTRKHGDAVELNVETITPIPPDIIINHGNVVMVMDIMKVNGVPFITLFSWTFKFGSARELTSTDIDHVLIALKTIVGKYQARCFIVISIAVDNGFAALREYPGFLALEVTLNLTSEDDHEPHIERFNRTLKKRCRMIYASIPFLRLPRRMIIELVYQQIFWYNFTIPEDYISTVLGPTAIVLGRSYDYNMISSDGSKYGEYVKIHEKTDNTMRARTVSAICLLLSGNQ